jgi:hypothetical protein
VGRNEIFDINLSGGYSWKYDPATGLGSDEAQTEYGDSGAPSFYVAGPLAVLAGTHTSNNIDTGVSAHRDAIAAAIGEPISVSSGLIGDVNGDYRVNAFDSYMIVFNLHVKQGARLIQGDVTGDGSITFADLGVVAAARGKTLYAPTDFNRDGKVNGSDLIVIGDRWNQLVAKPFTSGDANGDSFVDFDDATVFHRNQRRAYFGPLPPPLSPVKGDFDGNGIVDGADSFIVNQHFNQEVPPGTNGDVDGNGLVDTSDLIFVLLHSGDSFGDLNGDHTVGPADFAVLAASWNQPVSGGRLAGDMNGDGAVTGQDAMVLFDWWSVSAGGFAPVTAPEPNSAVLALLAGWSLFSAAHRRRRIG